MSIIKFARLINSQQSPQKGINSDEDTLLGGLFTSSPPSDEQDTLINQWPAPIVIVPGLRGYPALTGIWLLSSLCQHRYVLLPVSKDRVGLFFSVAKLMPTMCGGTRRILYQVPEAGTIHRSQVKTLMRERLVSKLADVAEQGWAAVPEDWKVFRPKPYGLETAYGILHIPVHCVDNESREHATKAIDTALVQLGKAMKAYPHEARTAAESVRLCREVYSRPGEQWRDHVGERMSPYGTFRSMTRDHAKIGWDSGILNHLRKPSTHKYTTLFNVHFKQDVVEQSKDNYWWRDSGCWRQDDKRDQSVKFHRERWKNDHIRQSAWKNLKEAIPVTVVHQASNCYATYIHLERLSTYYLSDRAPSYPTLDTAWKAKARLIAKGFIKHMEHGKTLHQRIPTSSSYGYRGLTTYSGQGSRHTGLIIAALRESEEYLSRYWGIGLVYPPDIATNPNAGKHVTDSIILYRKGGENGRRKRPA